MPRLWEKYFNMRSGGRVSDLSILSSRIVKNVGMTKRSRSIQDGAKQTGGRCVVRSA